jgi:hypothetical protein
MPVATLITAAVMAAAWPGPGAVAGVLLVAAGLAFGLTRGQERSVALTASA